MAKFIYRILSFESAEIVNGQDIPYNVSIRNTKDNKINFSLFKNDFDLSLDLIELENSYERIRRRKFCIHEDKNYRYTLAVINVNFNETDKIKVDVKQDENGKEIKNIKTLNNLKQLRQKLYDNGFFVDGEKYVRYKRSSGSSRQGKCLFIEEKMLKHMEDWGECNIKRGNVDLASWESYKALSLSSIKGVIEIPVEGILYIPDFKDIVKEEVVSVESDGTKATSKRTVAEIKNDLWDGESLLDESVFTGAFKDKHMLLLRNKFFKSCAFKTKIQKWFADNKITDIKQLKGITLAKNIKDIKMITTPNSLKYLRFCESVLNEKNIENWSKCVDDNFGVVKYDKRTRFFDGNMVRSSYQFLNTLEITGEEANRLLKPSVDYLRLLREDPAFMNHYFEHVISKEKEIDDGEEKENEGLESRAEIIFKLMKINNDFYKTRIYENFRKDFVDDYKKKMKIGHVLLSGTNATLFGNGTTMLRATIKSPISEGDCALKKGTVRCLKFKDGEKLLCARSPHITMGNLYVATNDLSNPIWEYFDLGENIVCVNAFKENLQQRLNGCDYDSDTMLITNNPLLIEKAEKYYNYYPVPVCNIKQKSNNDINLLTLDINTSVNKIGEIVNLSQYLNSYLWDRKNSGVALLEANARSEEEIYNDICILSVLSGIEIDKAKRNYDVDCEKSLKAIREKYKKEIKLKPMFFAEINKSKRRKVIEKKDAYFLYNTSMDTILQKVEDLFNFRSGREKAKEYLPISAMLKKEKSNVSKTDYNHRDKVMNICKEYKDKIKNLKAEIKYSNDDEVKEIHDKINELINERDEKVSELCADTNVLLLVIEELEKQNTEDWYYYQSILGDKNQAFSKLLKESKEKLPEVVEDEKGIYDVFGYKFSKKN